MTDDKNIRLAIIGLGHIGGIHIEALSRLPNFDLVVVCDNSIERHPSVPSEVPHFSCHREMLDRGGFETAIIATPSNTHHDFSVAALQAGFNVIVEKPAGNNQEELRLLELEARKNKKHVYYAFHAAMAEEVLWISAHLQEREREFGPLTAFVSKFHDPYLNPEDGLATQSPNLDNCWRDSGVNALSVLDRFLDLNSLRIADQRLNLGHSKDSFGFHNVGVHYHFPVGEKNTAGLGILETSWDRGLNYKCTELHFGLSGWRLVIDHSEQSVTALSPEGGSEVLVKFDGERLLNHYLSLFTDYFKQYQIGVMNADTAWRIHDHLFLVGERN